MNGAAGGRRGILATARFERIGHGGNKPRGERCAASALFFCAPCPNGRCRPLPGGKGGRGRGEVPYGEGLKGRSSTLPFLKA